MAKITVLATDIHIVSVNNEDYICITDMLKAKDGLHIRLVEKPEHT